MKKAKLYFISFLIVLVFLPTALFAPKKESLAIFSFNGGNASDGEAIASSLSRQAALRNAFTKTTLITRSTIEAMNFEQRFQRSGLTDADTIFELGKALNASHVIAGYITRLGNNNLVLVSIMDVESLQQIAGDYRTYRSIEEIDKLLPNIAQKLAVSVTRNTSGLPGLSVPPFNIFNEVNQNEAMILAQLLACELANGNKFAVLPRTDSVESVLAEHKRQRSGITNQERVKLLGAGRNAQYVLSGSIQRLGTLNKFTADILNISDGSFVEGHEESYTTLSQGLEILPKLVVHLIWKVSLSEIKDSPAGNYSIEITQKIQINTGLDSSGFENKTVTIQGGGSITFSGDSSFSIRKDVVIILDNISILINGKSLDVYDGGKLEMRKNAIIYVGLGVYVESGGVFIINEGQITGGIGVHGTLIMNGGTMKGGESLMSGRSVLVKGGTFTMNGGNIRGNKAYSGCGVYVEGGTFTMKGGEISNNIADYNGGGVYVNYKDGRFIKEKGKAKISSTNRARSGSIVWGQFYGQSGLRTIERNKEAGESVTLDSSISGIRGGWK